MTGPDSGVGEIGARPSPFWRLFFRMAYGSLRLIDPAIRVWWRRRLPGIRGVVDVEVRGRRTGRRRRTLLTQLVVEGAIYIGHPNGPSGWTRNAEAAGFVSVLQADGRHERYRPIRLHAGPERERVIAETWVQQPFAGNVVYWLARDHVRAVGMYYRLAARDQT